MLFRKTTQNHPELAVLEHHSRKAKSRAKTLASRKAKLTQVRCSLAHELAATSQAYALLNSISQALDQERASLDPALCQQKAASLAAQQVAQAQDYQAIEQLAAQRDELQKVLEAKRSLVEDRREATQAARDYCESLSAENSHARQACTVRNQALRQKQQQLQTLDEELTQLLDRTEAELEGRAKHIEELVQRLDLVEASLRNRRYA